MKSLVGFEFVENLNQLKLLYRLSESIKKFSACSKGNSEKLENIKNFVTMPTFSVTSIFRVTSNSCNLLCPGRGKIAFF